MISSWFWPCFFHLASKYCHEIVIPTPNWKSNYRTLRLTAASPRSWAARALTQPTAAATDRSTAVRPHTKNTHTHTHTSTPLRPAGESSLQQGGGSRDMSIVRPTGRCPVRRHRPGVRQYRAERPRFTQTCQRCRAYEYTMACRQRSDRSQGRHRRIISKWHEMWQQDVTWDTLRTWRFLHEALHDTSHETLIQQQQQQQQQQHPEEAC